MGGYKLNLIGMTFGDLVVTGFEGNVRRGKGTYASWHCRCSCGVERTVLAKHLKSGTTISCGCRANAQRRAAQYVKHRVDLEREATRVVHRSYLKRVRNSARAQNLDFNLTQEDIEALLIKQKFLCAISGLPIHFASSTLSNVQSNKLHTASLRRIDTARGYNLNNVEWIHKNVGRMRMGISKDHFLILCRTVASANITLRPSEALGSRAP